MRRPPRVPEGKWGTQIVFWAPVIKTVENENGEQEEDRFFFMRTLHGLQRRSSRRVSITCEQVSLTPARPLVIDYQPAEEAVEAICWAWAQPAIRRGQGVLLSQSGLRSGSTEGNLRVSRRVLRNRLPRTGHCTEHESRLNWTRKEKENTYALGELDRRDWAACFVCRELGVPASDDLTNHIAYLGNWLQAMKNDSRFIFMAIGTSQQSR